jgi:histidine triad (HIT) family protein
VIEKENKKEDCIFCNIAQGKIPCDKIYEEDNFIVFNDIKPISEGHCLIIPKKHYATIFDIPSILGTELINTIKRQGLRLIKEEKADGIKIINNNYESAGQVVKHFHIHVVPYKKDNPVKDN